MTHPDARAERTEPATGEDVEVVARALNNAGWTCDGGTHEPGLYDDCAECLRWCREGAQVALAALDLPGRERALREEIEALRNARLLSVIFGHHEGAPRPFALCRPDRTVIALGAEFPDGAVALRTPNHGWTTRSEGGAEAFLAHDSAYILWLSDELESLAEMEQERDAANAALANVTASLDDLKNAYDQLHVARDNTARLLEEARGRLDEIKGLHREAKGTLCVECGHLWPCQTYQLTLPDARRHAGDWDNNTGTGMVG